MFAAEKLAYSGQMWAPVQSPFAGYSSTDEAIIERGRVVRTEPNTRNYLEEGKMDCLISPDDTVAKGEIRTLVDKGWMRQTMSYSMADFDVFRTIAAGYRELEAREQANKLLEETFKRKEG